MTSQYHSRINSMSEEGLALSFAEDEENVFQYVPNWNKWLIWDGHQWLFDDKLFVYNAVRQHCRKVYLNNTSYHADLFAKTVNAVHMLAKSDPRLVATAAQWDKDPWLLNTPFSTIDLRDGHWHEPEPGDYCTKSTSVTPSERDHPIWTEFLVRVTGGDEGLQKWLQKISGYALTGITVENALYFLYGTGQNGKSVFLNTIAGVMGDYAKSAPAEMLYARSNDRHPTELARLRGARLVHISELDDHRPWNEAKIKALTGGDTVTARFMRQDFFEFTPEFKIFITANHMPSLRRVDEAIRQRFNIVPFSCTIPPLERDLSLFENLKAEWSSILGWMVEGALEWVQFGLIQPACASELTRDYLAEEDSLSVWMAECCKLAPRAFTTTMELFGSWEKWAKSNGEPVESVKRFSQGLKELHLISKRQSGTGRWGFVGITLQSNKSR